MGYGRRVGEWGAVGGFCGWCIFRLNLYIFVYSSSSFTKYLNVNKLSVH